MRYSDLVLAYGKLATTTKRLEKTAILAGLLKETPTTELAHVILLVQGRVFPHWDKRTLGVSSKLAVKAIAQATGETEQQVTKRWRETGDLGKVAAELVGKRKQATLIRHDLSIVQVVETLRKLPAVEGHGSVSAKLGAIAGLFAGASPEEAQFLIRTVLEELRLGVAEGVLRDAIAQAFIWPRYGLSQTSEGVYVWNQGKETSAFDKNQELTKIVQDFSFVRKIKEDLGLEQDEKDIKAFDILRAVEAIVQAAFDRCNDFAQVARVAKEQGIAGLRGISFTLGAPIRVMLAQREASVHDALERCGRPAALEYKYDGFRMQVHKRTGKEGRPEVTLFTRRLENVTEQFPEVVETVNTYVKAKDCLLDCEAVGYDPETGKYTAFQAISQRIRRKYDIAELAGRLPVELVIFDVLELDGEETLERPFAERRALLKKALVKEIPQRIRLSAFLQTSDDQVAEKFYQEALATGNEGVLVKNLAAPYQPGTRVGTWVKVKPTLDTMDLVIVAAEWGEGKRSGWLTSFTLACFDPVEDELLTIGRVGTGLKELESGPEDGAASAVTFDKLTKMLSEDIIEEHGREVTVRPRVVLEVKFEEIQQSPSYSSGFALRFPRVVRLREDRGVEDITTLEEVRIAARAQRGRE